MSTPNNSKHVTFGSRRLITFIRVSQILSIAFFLWFPSVGEPWAAKLFGLCIVAGVEYSLSTIVYGTLTDDGLTYQWWLKPRHVAWAEIAYGGVAPTGFIRVRLRGRPIWSRYLLLRAPEPPLKDSEANLPGAIRFCDLMEPPSGRTN
jgi:hypothetical protein